MGTDPLLYIPSSSVLSLSMAKKDIQLAIAFSRWKFTGDFAAARGMNDEDAPGYKRMHIVGFTARARGKELYRAR